jgi:hypothetical protein
MTKVGKLPRPTFTDKCSSEVEALALMKFHSDQYRSHYIRHRRDSFTVVYFKEEPNDRPKGR